jgi:Kef-type K+ transport system membrane component KefB/glycine cleavage system regulatory protein
VEAASLLLRLLALLVAARCAAELAERLRLPAVLVEISAGVMLGPSLLGWIGHDESLKFLGELGAIFLLLEVGLHMDLADLRRVGGSAMSVAVVGVVVPMAGGFVAMRALGIDGQVALFLAAGITATSVGITARVFADMRSLASREAQTVLGAAVADDVIGLLILTVVTRLSTTGSIEISGVLQVAAIGIGFVVAATALGAWLAPLVFDRLVGRARTEGTLLGGGVAFTLAFAGLAAVAGLAAIVGAFVAGLSLGRIKERDDLSRRLAPVGHLFVPVFFLLIGAEAQVGALADPKALALIAALGVVAVIGKIVAGAAVRRGTADRLLIGIGMLPRGEVGVVFATLGLTSGVLGAREHAALLFVVLATTMAAPPALRWRIERTRRAAHASAVEDAPPEGWLDIGDEVELRAEPPPSLAPLLGLDAALACAQRRPGPRLLDWLTRAPASSPQWDEELRTKFLQLLRDGNPRSWRLLDVTGLLRVLLPDIDEALRKRQQDPFDLDPSGALRWDEVEAVNDFVRSDDPAARLWPAMDQDVALVAALARSAYRGREAAASARRLAQTIGLRTDQAAEVEFLVADRDLLPAAAARLSMGREETVLELAAHVGNRSRADALYLLAVAGTRDPTARDGMDELWALITSALVHPELTGVAASGVVEARKEEVVRALPRIPAPEARRLLDAAPRRYLLAHDPETIARHGRMLDPLPTRNEVRLHADPDLERSEWKVHVVTLDKPGTLAAIARAFAVCGIPILEASVSTWTNGAAVDVFRVAAGSDVDFGAVRDAATSLLTGGSNNGGPSAIAGTLSVDNAASPWHTIVEVRAADRDGLLHRVAEAFSRAGIQIHHATARTDEGVAVDWFLVTGPDGHKLSADGENALRLVFDGKSPGRWPSRRLRRSSGRLKGAKRG